MPEIPGRFIESEAAKAPAAGSWKLLYAVPDTWHSALSVHITNGTGSDAFISLWIIPYTVTWADGQEPPDNTFVSKRILIESSTEPGGIVGNIWGSPVLYFNQSDRLVALTTVAGVTFYPHGVGSTGFEQIPPTGGP